MKMTGSEFDFDVLSKGSFIDDLRNEGSSIFKGEVFSLRLNHIALNEYITSSYQNDREVYPDGETGKEQWLKHIKEKELLHSEWKEKIISILGINKAEHLVFIKQTGAEIFSVFYLNKM
jgi:hypothetical protein